MRRGGGANGDGEGVGDWREWVEGVGMLEGKARGIDGDFGI